MTTVSQKLTQVKPDHLVAGFDLGLDSLAVVVLEANGSRVDRFKE